MKALLTFAAAIFAAFTLNASEQKPAQPVAKQVKSWTDGITVSAVGAFKHENLGGKPIYGTGLDIGLSLNKTVSLHLENLAFQTDSWKGAAIDETEAIVSTTVIRQNKLSLNLLASGGHEWNRDDWGFGAGAGIDYELAKNLKAGIAYRVRAWFNHDKDGIGTAAITYCF